MTFQDLQYHFEGNATSIDHLCEESYLASNCINGHSCIVENLEYYSVPTLCHYFYELGIPAPDDMRDDLNRYRELRDEVYGKLKVPKVEG